MGFRATHSIELKLRLSSQGQHDGGGGESGAMLTPRGRDAKSCLLLVDLLFGCVHTLRVTALDRQIDR